MASRELQHTTPGRFRGLLRPGENPAASGRESSQRRSRTGRPTQRVLHPGPGWWAGRESPVRSRGGDRVGQVAPQRTGRAHALRGRQPPRWPVRVEHSSYLRPQRTRELRDVPTHISILDRHDSGRGKGGGGAATTPEFFWPNSFRFHQQARHAAQGSSVRSTGAAGQTYRL